MDNNYCVIMGGGIGSRFWPFSRENRPKQFLDFFGTGRSLRQMTVDRFAKIIPKEHIYIVTNRRYVGMVHEQLPFLADDQILAEPARRNTAPCIAYASYRIKARCPQANIVVAPSDHLILKENEFLDDVRKSLDFVAKHRALVTLGVKPSRPETGYGYIQSSDERQGDFVKVKTFTEKPNRELAQVFMDSGEFFWNSGLFVWNVDTILEAIRRHLPDISARFDIGPEKFNTPAEAAFIEEHFPFCPSISIDYGVMEKANNAVLKTRAMLYESEDNIVAIEDRNRLAVIQGLKDYIVVESGNVLLICRKTDEQRIKQYMADAQIRYGDEFN